MTITIEEVIMAVVETDSVVFHSSFGATLVVQAVVASVEEVASEVVALEAEVLAVAGKVSLNKEILF